MATATSKITTRLMVGMEVHVELATRSKMWTSAPNVAHPDYFDAEPNTLLDPVVVGMPGVLPVLNKQAVEMAMLVGLALGCQIARQTKWDRKSYYYPDLPKNYQISQYDMPLCGAGVLKIPTSDQPGAPTKTVGIIRAHLEEDAGKLLHEAPGGIPIDHSIVDLNRAGTPLLEIVTGPDLETPDECVMLGQSLRNICRHLGVSAGIMQKGQVRFEPNINVTIEYNGQTFKTPIVEIKNLNSFKALHGAVAYEYRRQVDQWRQTGRVMAERAKTTRGWDDVKGVTTLQRQKEDADEYRYFPDPDLVTLEVNDAWRERVRSRLPELPLAKQRRYVRDLGLSSEDARVLADEPRVARFYERVLETGVNGRRAAAMLRNYGAKRANERNCFVCDLGISPQQIHDIAELAAADRVGSTAADELFGYACDSDAPAEQLAHEHGLMQVSDVGALAGYVDEVLANPRNAKVIVDIKGGKDKAIGALLGQVMKLSKGKANPKLLRQMMMERLR